MKVLGKMLGKALLYVGDRIFSGIVIAVALIIVIAWLIDHGYLGG